MTTRIDLGDGVRRALAGLLIERGDDPMSRLIGPDTPGGARGTLSLAWLAPNSALISAGPDESALYVLAGAVVQGTAVHCTAVRGNAVHGTGAQSATRPREACGGEPVGAGGAFYRSGGALAVLWAGPGAALLLEATVPAAPGSDDASGPLGPALRVGSVADDGRGVLGATGGSADMGVNWLVTRSSAGSRAVTLATSTFEPGGSHDLHCHPGADEFFLVVEGGGEHLTARGPLRLDPAGLVFVPAGEPHGFRTDPGITTRAVYGYLGAASLEAAGYQLVPEETLR